MHLLTQGCFLRLPPLYPSCLFQDTVPASSQSSSWATLGRTFKRMWAQCKVSSMQLCCTHLWFIFIVATICYFPSISREETAVQFLLTVGRWLISLMHTALSVKKEHMMGPPHWEPAEPRQMLHCRKPQCSTQSPSQTRAFQDASQKSQNCSEMWRFSALISLNNFVLVFILYFSHLRRSN